MLNLTFCFQAEKEVGAPSPVARCESVVVFSFITENLSPLEIHVLRVRAKNSIVSVCVYIL